MIRAARWTSSLMMSAYLRRCGIPCISLPPPSNAPPPQVVFDQVVSANGGTQCREPCTQIDFDARITGTRFPAINTEASWAHELGDFYNDEAATYGCKTLEDVWSNRDTIAYESCDPAAFNPCPSHVTILCKDLAAAWGGLQPPDVEEEVRKSLLAVELL